MTGRVRRAALVGLMVAATATTGGATATTVGATATTGGATATTVGATAPPAGGGGSALPADSVERLRQAYLARSAFEDLGARCRMGALRVFPRDTSEAARDAVQRLAEAMEWQVLLHGAGEPLDTLAARPLLQTLVAWETGSDRPRWDVAGDVPGPEAIAAGLTGDVPDPRGPGCLPSPMQTDTMTVVIPAVRDLPLPGAARPRVRAFFGPEAQRQVRNDFVTRLGERAPAAELSYLLVAPVVLWQDWAVVGVRRPVEPGGVRLDGPGRGGAAYLFRRVGGNWRLLAIVRSWGG